MSPLVHLLSARCKLCSERTVTYSYLRSIYKKSQNTTSVRPTRGFSITGCSSKGHGGYREREKAIPFGGVTTMCHKSYSTRIPPEKKKVYQNPKLCYVWNPDLAKLIRSKIWPDGSLEKEKALVVDCNAGPGILSKELLNAGAQRLISIERNSEFLPRLKELQNDSDGRLLQALHADFYKMQYHGDTPYARPVIRIKELFQDISPVSWESDVPIKVIGCFPHRKEKTQAYLFASLMLERLSIYSYGRAQFNFFLSENCYETLTQPPGSYFKYRALSAFYQLGFDIKLLHKEPLSSFSSPSTVRSSNSTDPAYLYLTQLTPKQDLFLRHNLSQQQAFVFVYFMRQSLSKRSAKLTEIIE
ncbi:mitochondrial transcription factor 2M [Apostichopus japonicus]|uniref:rRNA adenine N(6)-methyltransferase n=1 Tax=Stichopus japonicus TaxID=307972 RepID=A0A2G8K1S0_STIJA|nr:mitochondrial transcription factor 2M [Apostichopus japonicus]